MSEVLAGKLYYGPPPKSKTMRELEEYVTLFVNLRTRTATSHWYSAKKINTIELEIPREEVYEDKGRNVKDKNKTVQQLVEQIANRIRNNGEVVYIHCDDGHSTCGPIVLGVWYWLANNDPLTEMRNRLDFAICTSREQRAQLDAIKLYADKKRKWNEWKFPPKAPSAAEPPPPAAGGGQGTKRERE